MTDTTLEHDASTNNPPEPTTLEQVREEVSLLDIEAAAWFDGAPIENEAQAADVARLLDHARKIKKRAEDARKEEKEPHLQAGKAVDEKWKPLVADLDRIGECAKKAQTDWLIKLDKVKREQEAEARRKADEAAAEARRLASATDGSLDAAKARDAAIEEAKKAEREAARAESATANAKGEGMARAVGLRTVYLPKVVDRRLLLNHIAVTDPDALTAFVEDWAAKSVRAGKRSIPGVEVVEERRAA